MWSLWRDPGNGKAEIYTAIITCCLVALFAAIRFLWNVKKSKKMNNASLPPGPRGLPLIGYLPFLGIDLHMAFTELAGVYGPIYRLWLGKKLCVVVSSPSLVKEVVRDQDAVFANRDPPAAVLLSSYGDNDIAWRPYDPEWKKLRKLFVGNMMSKGNLDASYSFRKKEVENAIRDVYKKIGKPVDIGELSTETLIHVVQNMLWGGSIEGEKGTDDDNLGAEFRKLFAELMVLLGTPNISDFFPVLSRFDIQGIQKRVKKIISCIHEIFNTAIERRREMVPFKKEAAGTGKTERSTDFLQFLLELKESEDTATSITMDQLQALLVDIILGGTDTTTTMVEWAMAELMQHPEGMKKVHEELAEVVGMDKSIEEFHLPKLRYLDAVVKETLRLHPALPLLVPRSPSQSATIGGYFIPKGARIMVNVWAIHRDPQLWDNPLEFLPERFLNDPGKFDYMGTNFQYMPFGSGRRGCAGIPLAERMVLFVLASLLHSFEWELPYGADLDLSERFGIVIKKMKPLVAVPTPRLSNPELYK